MRYILRAIFVVVLACLYVVGGANLVAAQPQANIQQSLCDGGNLSLSGGTTCISDPAAQQLDRLVQEIINLFSVIVGIIAVIMIIVGGVKYVTSGGESSAVSSAKNTILYAIIGLIVVALAQVIVKFVLNQLYGVVGY